MDYYNLPIGAAPPPKVSSYYKEYDASLITNNAVRYYSRWLMQKAMSVFDWTLPDSWDKNFFLYTLYQYGSVAIADIPPYGVIPQACTFSGFNIYYNPAKILISNPYLPKSYEFTLGSQAELLSLSPDYMGLLDVVQTYAEMLANALCSVNTNLYNSRLSYVFYAKNSKHAMAYKKMYDEIGTGKPAVFIDNTLGKSGDTGEPIEPFMPFNAELSKNYIASNILQDMQRILDEFYQMVGIPNSQSSKTHEQSSVAEVNKSDSATSANVVVWESWMRECLTRVKRLYPDLKLSFTRHYSYEEQEGETPKGGTGEDGKETFKV